VRFLKIICNICIFLLYIYNYSKKAFGKINAIFTAFELIDNTHVKILLYKWKEDKQIGRLEFFQIFSCPGKWPVFQMPTGHTWTPCYISIRISVSTLSGIWSIDRWLFKLGCLILCDLPAYPAISSLPWACKQSNKI
jgi:hypothetical protein